MEPKLSEDVAPRCFLQALADHMRRCDGYASQPRESRRSSVAPCVQKKQIPAKRLSDASFIVPGILVVFVTRAIVTVSSIHYRDPQP